MGNARSRSRVRPGAGHRSRRPIREREVLLVKDLDDETLDLIRTAKPSQRSIELDYLMEEEEEGKGQSPRLPPCAGSPRCA
jgi:hypothetical protein